MKIYAEQIAPEYQESPLFWEDLPENVYIYGNSRLKGNGAKEIENIKNSIYDAAAELKYLLRGCLDYSFKRIIDDNLPAPEYKKEYSRADRLEWRRLLLAFDSGAITDDDAVTGALELITGKEYAIATIRGCCQSDWSDVIYPAEYGREWLKNFEIEFFNLGDEWRIIYDEPDGPVEFCIYTHDWSDDGKRAEIADAAGANPDDVILLAFDGWIRTPVYKEV